MECSGSRAMPVEQENTQWERTEVLVSYGSREWVKRIKGKIGSRNADTHRWFSRRAMGRKTQVEASLGPILQRAIKDSNPGLI